MSLPAPTLRRLRSPVPLLLVAVVAAWIVVIAVARRMGPMTGTMGVGLVSFAAMWGLMVAAMMLPSVAPFVSMYSQAVRDDRGLRLGALGGGYLMVWTLPAFPVYAIAWASDRAALTHPLVPRLEAIVALAACGVYQLTPLKDRCLTKCRSPLSDAFKYASYRGRTRDLRVGVSHGRHCLGCCWAVMGLMLTFGLMNVTAMVVLTAVCAIEKVWSRGTQFARGVGVAALALAVLIVVDPAFAPWLHHLPTMVDHSHMNM